MAQGDVGVRVGADTTGLQAGMVQAAVVTEAQMKKIAQMVKAANDATANLGRTSQKAANDVAAAHESIAAGARKVEGAHAGVNRELLVLAHEMSQGNYSRFGGSLLVLAERTNFLSFALTGTGAAISAVGAAVLGAAVLMAMGAIEADKFAKALQLTGNYAAVTEQSIRELADAQAKQTGQTSGAARGSIEAAAGSGLFGPSELAAVSRAMGDYQKLTHTTAEEALKNFEKIQDGVAKWAEEQNRSVHFLTLTEYEHIKSLVDSGNKQQAVVETLNSYATAIEGRAAPSLGTLAKAWRAVTEAASSAKEAMMRVGMPETTDSRLADMQAQLEELTKRGPRGSSPDMSEMMGRGRTRGDQVASLQRQIAGLQALAAAEKQARDASASRAALEASAIDAQKDIDEWLRRTKAVDAYAEEVRKKKAEFATLAQAGSPVSASNQTAILAQLKKEFTDRSTSEAATQYSSLTAMIDAFNKTSNDELASLKKVTEGQRLKIQVQEELERSTSKLTAGQRNSVLAAASQAASLRDVADASLALRKSLNEDADRAIKESTAAFNAGQRAIESFKRSGATKVGDIEFQTSLIGKDPEQAAEMQAKRAIDIAANQALEAAGGQRLNEILAEQARQRDEVTEAMGRQSVVEKQYAASFSDGFNKGFREVMQDAANTAAQAEKLTKDAFGGMTDAAVQFGMTGKFSVKSLVDSIISDLIRMETQALEAKVFGGGGGGGFMGILGAAISAYGGTSGTATAASAMSGDSLDNFLALNNNFSSHANGLSYVPYDGYPAILHEGERVTSRQDAAIERSGNRGATIKIDMSGMSFGAGVDASGVAQAVRTGMAQTKAEIYRAMNTGRLQ